MENLIIGASGLVGSHILRALPAATSMGTYFCHPPTGAGYPFVHLDLYQKSAVVKLFDALRPQTVYLAAAASDVDWCEANQARAAYLNAELPVHIGRLCAERGLRFLFLSSDMVFDGRQGDYREEDEPAPLNWYGTCKWHAEQALQQSVPDAAIIRSALVYGLPALGGYSHGFLVHLIEKLRAGEPAALFHDQYRTPIFVEELATACIAVAHSRERGIFHLGGSEKVNRLQFGRYVCATFRLDARLLQPASLADAAFVAQRPADLSLNSSRFVATFRQPLSDCRSGLARAAAARN